MQNTIYKLITLAISATAFNPSQTYAIDQSLENLPANMNVDFICKFHSTSIGVESEDLFDQQVSNNLSRSAKITVNGQTVGLRPLNTKASNASNNQTLFGKEKKRVNTAEFSGISELIVEGDNRNRIDIARQLEADGIVEYCDLIVEDIPPPADIPPTTPDFTNQQRYFGSDPGIDAAYAHSIGIRGRNITIADAEYNFQLSHEDLEDQGIIFANNPLDQFPQFDGSHGTSVVSIWASGHNGYGVNGTLPEAKVRVYSQSRDIPRVQAIIDAVNDLQEGDVLVLEMQSYSRFDENGQGSALAPADYNISVWDVVKSATDAGIHVVAAAGNGNVDLDTPYYDDYRSRGDNGSIIVGAGTDDVFHSKMSFSTFGNPVHLQGWGRNVYSADYNASRGIDNDPRQSYRNFSGTSSATPLVATAVALVQDYAEQTLAQDIAPRAMRQLLIDTGISQGSGGNIGPLPNIRRAIEALEPNGGITDTIVAFNLAADAYTAIDGAQFADGSSLDGASWRVSDAIAGTDDDIIFQSQKFGSNLNYSLAVPNGTYRVKLYMAELFFTSAGQRLFDISIEGNLVKSNYDAFLEVGHDTADIESFENINVTDGLLDINLNANLSDAMINGIVVETMNTASSSSSSSISSVSSSSTSSSSNSSNSSSSSSSNSSVTSIFEGYNLAGDSYTLMNGRLFNEGNSLDGASWSVSDVISGTNDDALFQSQKFGSNLSYSFDVPNGNYRVTIYTAELFFTNAGQRTFNIAIENNLVKSNYDVFLEVGHDGADIETFNNISVTDDIMNIDLNGTLSDAIINGISIESM